jgi:hypothetical protein
MSGANVLATDYRDEPFELLKASATRTAERLGRVEPLPLNCALFDVTNEGSALPDLGSSSPLFVCAADLLYMKSTAIALASRCVEALQMPAIRAVLVGDLGRPGRAAFLAELQRLGVMAEKAHFESVLALDDAPVAVFVGYLASDTQLTEVVGVLDRHPKRIARVIVDPVSGDQGRAYVAPELIAAWPQLLERADLAFPNATELSLIVPGGPHDAVDRWRDRFPRLETIVTGVPVGDHSLRSILHRPGRPASGQKNNGRP